VAAVISGLQPGEILTYGEVAVEAGFPGAARAVGSFLRTCDETMPWWRVVGSGGRIRTPNPLRQEDLLRAEGFIVIAGKVVG
jgi:methylated-DNA-protein-cysteine methyltransferase related protein